MGVGSSKIILTIEIMQSIILPEIVENVDQRYTVPRYCGIVQCTVYTLTQD